MPGHLTPFRLHPKRGKAPNKNHKRPQAAIRNGRFAMGLGGLSLATLGLGALLALGLGLGLGAGCAQKQCATYDENGVCLYASLLGDGSDPNAIACASNTLDCDGNPDNGCETPIDDGTHCGACDVQCTANQTCALGTGNNRTCQELSVVHLYTNPGYALTNALPDVATLSDGNAAVAIPHDGQLSVAGQVLSDAGSLLAKVGIGGGIVWLDAFFSPTGSMGPSQLQAHFDDSVFWATSHTGYLEDGSGDPLASYSGHVLGHWSASGSLRRRDIRVVDGAQTRVNIHHLQVSRDGQTLWASGEGNDGLDLGSRHVFFERDPMVGSGGFSRATRLADGSDITATHWTAQDDPAPGQTAVNQIARSIGVVEPQDGTRCTLGQALLGGNGILQWGNGQTTAEATSIQSTSANTTSAHTTALVANCTAPDGTLAAPQILDLPTTGVNTDPTAQPAAHPQLQPSTDGRTWLVSAFEDSATPSENPSYIALLEPDLTTAARADLTPTAMVLATATDGQGNLYLAGYTHGNLTYDGETFAPYPGAEANPSSALDYGFVLSLTPHMKRRWFRGTGPGTQVRAVNARGSRVDTLVAVTGTLHLQLDQDLTTHTPPAGTTDLALVRITQ